MSRIPNEIIGQRISGSAVVPFLVEVKLKGDDSSTMFRRVRETLERTGIASNREANVLIQTCHILHKAGRYYITHYKFLYCLDGGENRVMQHDIDRQSKIIHLLQDWNMIEVFNPDQIAVAEANNLGDIKVLKHNERKGWTMKANYHIGVENRHHRFEHREAIAA